VNKSATRNSARNPAVYTRMKMSWKALRIAVGILALTSLLAGAELPVRTVVLYKHGVGYFERQGTLGPGESARLDFKAEEMNDVLKSLTINDQGGKVTGLRYDSSIPLEQKLADFPFRIADGEPLSAVIDQLKGARIELEFGQQKISGAIVSARLIAGDKEHAEREQLTLLLDSGDMRNVDLAAASAVRFTDAKLQSQFKDYLAELTSARSKDKRSVYIDSTDSKSHEVRAEYITPMPAWKSSYRLLFDKTAGQATLEGWAIVDNTTGEDWNNVHMSLVSGKPISFISQLYAPKYINRPGAELAEDQAVAPTVYSGAVRKTPANAGQATFGAPGGVIGGVMGSGGGGGFGGGRLAPPPAPMAQMSTIAAVGTADEIADLFEYTIAAPVTVRKDESAMLPFLQQKIDARKLIIYSDTGKPNPLSAAELTNKTGKTLDGGPITVYDAGAYAGEALVETVKAGDKRFISYGVDLGTRISTALDSRTDDVRELHVHNGMLATISAMVQKTTYSIHNVDPREKTLIVEYPIRSGYSLVDTAKPSETARDVYRFEIKVPANGSVDFPITAENVYNRQLSISSLNSDALLVYIRNRNVSDAARRQLQQISDLKTQIVNTDSEKRSVTEQIAGASQDEERNRQNISSLSSVSGQQQVVQDYARRLSEQETQIGKFRERQTALDRQKEALQTQLNGLIGGLEF
jgi:hypothetical protein